MHADDFIIVDMENKIEDGKADFGSRCISRFAMRPDIRSIVHAHPPVATGFATMASRSMALLPSDHRAGMRTVTLQLPGALR